jgi:hypothetical protein
VKVLSSDTTEIQWLKLCKSVFNIEEDIYLGIVYVSPIHSPFAQKSDEDIFSILESNIAHYSNLGNCIVCGDFNARTSLEQDYCNSDNLDKYLDISSTLVSTHHLDRRNCDKHKVDNHGQKLLSLCKSSDLRILNGRIFGDSIGHVTCYSHNGLPSTIDYVLASEGLFPMIESFHVHNPSPFSIHCVLSTVLRVQ